MPVPTSGRVLGLETSCDETAAAVVTSEGLILSNVVSSQAELHARFGGVVPEVASRRHLELVGYLVISRYVDAWHVMNVAVAGDHRRRGIATMLLERLFEATAGRGRRGYTLEVRVSNAGAVALYERLGFKPRGVRRGYYTDNREDALIMWKDPISELDES